jgi:hypothetical protein
MSFADAAVDCRGAKMQTGMFSHLRGAETNKQGETSSLTQFGPITCQYYKLLSTVLGMREKLVHYSIVATSDLPLGTPSLLKGPSNVRRF